MPIFSLSASLPQFKVVIALKSLLTIACAGILLRFASLTACNSIILQYTSVTSLVKLNTVLSKYGTEPKNFKKWSKYSLACKLKLVPQPWAPPGLFYCRESSPQKGCYVLRTYIVVGRSDREGVNHKEPAVLHLRSLQNLLCLYFNK